MKSLARSKLVYFSIPIFKFFSMFISILTTMFIIYNNKTSTCTLWKVKKQIENVNQNDFC